MRKAGCRCWYAFKPNTDDIREAPALQVIEYLINNGAAVCAYDPEAMENVKKEYNNKISFASNQYSALEKADALIICTEWNEFRTPDFEMISTLLSEKVIFDGRNLYDNTMMESLGYYYESIGRKTVVRF